MRTGGQEDRKKGGQENKAGGTIHRLTHITIDVCVLHPALILLQLIINKILKKYLSINSYYYFVSKCSKSKKKIVPETQKELPQRLVYPKNTICTYQDLQWLKLFKSDFC